MIPEFDATGFRRKNRVALFAGIAAAALAAPRAHGFERQWQVGAGFGVVAPESGYELGGAAVIHGAYGLSDMFDARFDLRTSLHGQDALAVDENQLFQGTLGLAYKLDVIEWIPYFGVRGGYYTFTSRPVETWCGAPGSGARCARGGGIIGAMLGIDYAFTRHFAIGVEGGYDVLFPERSALSGLVRAEYRWGW